MLKVVATHVYRLKQKKNQHRSYRDFRIVNILDLHQRTKERSEIHNHAYGEPIRLPSQSVSTPCYCPHRTPGQRRSHLGGQ